MDQGRQNGNQPSHARTLGVITMLLFGMPIYFFVCLIAIALGFLRLGVLRILPRPSTELTYGSNRHVSTIGSQSDEAE